MGPGLQRVLVVAILRKLSGLERYSIYTLEGAGGKKDPEPCGLLLDNGHTPQGIRLPAIRMTTNKCQ